jgi:ribose-phosphate pyrophosphokinase
MIIVGLSNSRGLAKRIASHLRIEYQELYVHNFPDGEMNIRFMNDVKSKTVVLVQSLYPHPNYSLLEVLFAASTAYDLKAKKVILVCPYLAYMREDKRFNQGECISSKVVGELLSHAVEVLITIDPHLHRMHNLREVFDITVHNLSTAELIKEYIKENFNDAVVIGPDIESSNLAKRVRKDSLVFRKIRSGDYKVEIKARAKELEGRDVVILDDIVSTGRTILEAMEHLKKARSVNVIAIHGVFVGGALNQIMKKAKKIVSTNTIENETSEIDVSKLIANQLMKLK